MLRKHILDLLVMNFPLCHRKVIREMGSGERKSDRVKLTLEIKVEVLFGLLVETRYLGFGGTRYTSPSMWYAPFKYPAASADLVVLLMQEGLAHLFLIGKR
ncbi:hypothetical protein BHE74_00028729 [Ensete ventricosum]|nr:hypothetical protein GW17_00031308 [Ensete ventricosum]RWW64058.1 hypothetical protein BHE74_00028729 [Ensete ventricosum]RZS06136.1 hypothetical protein BHM03_00036747 [Ensete ventricosum]